MYANPVSIIKEAIDFECPLCLQPYNEGPKYPMMLCPSQHTCCLNCLELILFPNNQEAADCPFCKTKILKEHTTKFRLLNEIQQTAAKLKVHGSMCRPELGGRHPMESSEEHKDRQELFEELQKEKEKNEWLIAQLAYKEATCKEKDEQLKQLNEWYLQVSHEFIIYRQQHKPKGHREKAKLNAVMADDAAQQARGYKGKKEAYPKKKMKEPIKEKEIKMEASFQKPDMKKMVREYSKKGDAYQAKMQKGPPSKEQYEEDFGIEGHEQIAGKAAVMNNRKQLGYRPKLEEPEQERVKKYIGQALEKIEEPAMKYTNDAPIMQKEEPKMQYTDDGPISDNTDERAFNISIPEQKKISYPPAPVSKKEVRTDDGANRFKKSVVSRNVALQPWEKHQPEPIPSSKRGVRVKK